MFFVRLTTKRFLLLNLVSSINVTDDYVIWFKSFAKHLKFCLQMVNILLQKPEEHPFKHNGWCRQVGVCVTRHSERLDAGLHLCSVLLLQPGAVQQSDRGLQQLSHDGVMSLTQRETTI